MKRLEKLVRIRERQRVIAAAQMHAGRAEVARITADVAALEDAADAIPGEAVSTFHFEHLGQRLEHGRQALAQAHQASAQSLAVAQAASIASSRAEKLRDRARAEALSDGTRSEQRAQDERPRGSSWE